MDKLKLFLKCFGSGLVSFLILFLTIGIFNFNAQLGPYSPWIALIAFPACGWVNRWFWLLGKE